MADLHAIRGREGHRQLVFYLAAGDVVLEVDDPHLVAEHLTDLTELLRSVDSREAASPVPRGRGEEARTGGGTNQHGPGRARDITVPDLRLGSGIKVPTRDFR